MGVKQPNYLSSDYYRNIGNSAWPCTATDTGIAKSDLQTIRPTDELLFRATDTAVCVCMCVCLGGGGWAVGRATDTGTANQTYSRSDVQTDRSTGRILHLSARCIKHSAINTGKLDVCAYASYTLTA